MSNSKMIALPLLTTADKRQNDTFKTNLTLGTDGNQFSSVSQLRLPQMTKIDSQRSILHKVDSQRSLQSSKSDFHSRSNIDFKFSPLKVRQGRNQHSTIAFDQNPREFKTLTDEYNKIREKVLYTINLPAYDRLYEFTGSSSR